jgi:hypothetical protein
MWGKASRLVVQLIICVVSDGKLIACLLPQAGFAIELMIGILPASVVAMLLPIFVGRVPSLAF